MASGHALYVQRFDFQTRFLGRGQVSRNWGPTLRGGFGKALRKVSCSLGRESCQDCLLAASCAYGYVFETPILESAAVMRKYPEAPHPFVFEPSDQGAAAVREGEIVPHSLVVIGDAIRYLPHLFLALEESGKQGLGRDLVPFQIDSVRIHGGDFVYQQGDRRFREATCQRLSLEPGESRTARFSIEFHTPTRIVVAGQLASTPSLADIAKALCRRLFLLRYFHCGRNEEPISAAYVAAAGQARCLDHQVAWADAHRYSTRQARTVPIGGLTGRLTYEGDLGLLKPLLLAGQYVHVGKNATFGLGKMTLREGV